MGGCTPGEGSTLSLDPGRFASEETLSLISSESLHRLALNSDAQGSLLAIHQMGNSQDYMKLVFSIKILPGPFGVGSSYSAPIESLTVAQRSTRGNVLGEVVGSFSSFCPW